MSEERKAPAGATTNPRVSRRASGNLANRFSPPVSGGLLLDPGGCEGFVPLMNQEAFQAGGEAVRVQCPDGPALDIQLNPALCATTPRSLANQDLVAAGAELKRFDPLILDGIRLHPRPQRPRAAERRFESATDELNIGVDDLNRGIEVPPTERLIGPTQLLDVLPDIAPAVSRDSGSVLRNRRRMRRGRDRRISPGRSAGPSRRNGSTCRPCASGTGEERVAVLAQTLSYP